MGESPTDELLNPFQIQRRRTSSPNILGQDTRSGPSENATPGHRSRRNIAVIGLHPACRIYDIVHVYRDSDYITHRHRRTVAGRSHTPDGP